MLIISKFKDYYDGVVGTTGIDKSIIYNRDSKEFIRKDKDYPKFLINSYFLRKKTDVNPIVDLTPYHNPPLKKDILYQTYKYFVIGFCGKQYIGFKFFYEDKNTINNSIKYDIVYGYDNIISYLDMTKKLYHNNNNFEEKYNKIIDLNTINIFREYNTPTFIYIDSIGYYTIGKNKIDHQSEKFIINPILKDYEFYKVLDVYQTFQEINMFLGGVLGNNEKDIVEVDNKTKILKYGFDLKTSFRKDKSDK